MSDAEEKAATGVGVLGHLARLIVFGLIGAFLVRAAWEFDPKRGARPRRRAARALAAGRTAASCSARSRSACSAYALYCFVQARYRRI